MFMVKMTDKSYLFNVMFFFKKKNKKSNNSKLKIVGAPWLDNFKF